MSINPDSICYWCKHFRSKRVKFKFTCEAYPEGIPEAFFPHLETSELFDHRFSFPGDNGIQFELETDIEKLKSRPFFQQMFKHGMTEDKIYPDLKKSFEAYLLLRGMGNMLPALSNEEDAELQLILKKRGWVKTERGTYLPSTEPFEPWIPDNNTENDN
jgi:hypothetical protein